MGARATPGLFQGAKIKLGALPLNGKQLEDFKLSEVVYVIIRYMIANADGNTYHGNVTGILRKLWPESDGEISGGKMRGIYKLLRLNGVRHEESYGEDLWILTRQIGDDLPVKSDTSPIVRSTPAPVVYKCAFCHEIQPDSQSLKDHLEVHREENEVKVETVKHCDACNRDIPEKMYEGHMKTHSTVASPAPVSSEKKAERGTPRPCPVCGEIKRNLVTHMRGHETTGNMDDLYYQIIEQEGLHPRDYADRLSWERMKASRIGNQLVKRGLIRSEGERGATRYYSVGDKPQRKPIPTATAIPTSTASSQNYAKKNGTRITPAFLVEAGNDRFLFVGDRLERI